MSADLPIHAPPRRSWKRGIPLWVGLVLLAAHVVFFAVHTDRAARAFDATLRPPNTIPGMAEPRFFLDNDAYAWMAHTRDLMASGGWRLRHTFMDNAPHGRDMHWSHLLIWTMHGMASAIMVWTDWPAARAVELAGIWVMPWFQFICLGLALVVLSKKLGWGAAGLFCGLALSLNGFVWAFHPLRPDHHGLQLFAVLGAFICLQFGGFGWVRNGPAPRNAEGIRLFCPLTPPDPREATRWFIASGVLGGLALWFGATIWMFALGIIGLAVLSVMPLARRQAPADGSYRPDLWRIWAWSGVTAGLLFYLLEYAPNHFSMRLEVNHPWHWLFWLGAAECLRAAARIGPGVDLTRLRRSDWMFAAIGLLAVISLPAAILWGPRGWHLMHVAEMQRLHARFIEEFRSIRIALDAPPLTFFFLRFGLLPLVFPWAGWLLLRSKAQDHSRRLLPGLVFTGLFLLLFLWQQRWGFFMAGGMAWLFILGLAQESSPLASRSRRMVARVLAGALLANGLVAVGMRLRSEHLTADSTAVIPHWVHANLMKRMALQWGLEMGAEKWTLAGMAIEAPMIYYFTGIRTLASYYWENAEGWQAEASFFADAPAGQIARGIARQRGLTHACLNRSDELPKLYWYLATGRYSAREGMQQTLAGALAMGDPATLPGWIQLDPPLTEIGQRSYVFQTPRGYARQQTGGIMYRIGPDRPSEEGPL